MQVAAHLANKTLDSRKEVRFRNYSTICNILILAKQLSTGRKTMHAMTKSLLERGRPEMGANRIRSNCKPGNVMRETKEESRGDGNNVID